MQRIGIALLFVGVTIFLIISSAGVLEFILSPKVPVLLKVAVFSIFGGVVLIILSSIKEKWGEKDKYEGVKK